MTSTPWSSIEGRRKASSARNATRRLSRSAGGKPSLRFSGLRRTFAPAVAAAEHEAVEVGPADEPVLLAQTARGHSPAGRGGDRRLEVALDARIDGDELAVDMAHHSERARVTVEAAGLDGLRQIQDSRLDAAPEYVGDDGEGVLHKGDLLDIRALRIGLEDHRAVVGVDDIRPVNICPDGFCDQRTRTGRKLDIVAHGAQPYMETPQR
ncbi:hypothetical protein L0U85_00995 [Glycomyces sp. L485]|uniref:hypothetical protein n=1 Tax=Glycomyces sp. L485 TaxID=2909235 RepID=UPI001F4AB98D|nr:hypothetical protein [Glycomyces sp. L485]MCH7229444.1 hypothetical protein [Glycomyces sp. L485]